MARTTEGRTPERQTQDESDEEDEEEESSSVAAEETLFTINGRPALFHMYRHGHGKLSPGQIDTLVAKIREHGGEICEEEKDADVLLARHEILDGLKRKWWKSFTIYVCPPTFVQLCISTHQFRENLEQPRRIGMGGQPEGRSRTSYTLEDDENLCRYLAHVVPYKEAGGRGGMEIYNRLIEDARQHEEDRWGLRHTPSSWQTHYKYFHERLDPVIERIVAENPPLSDGKGLYERSRFYNKPGRSRNPFNDPHTNLEVEDSVIEDEDQPEIIVEVRSSPDRRKRVQEEDDDRRQAKRARHTDIGIGQAPSVEQARHAVRERPVSYSGIPSRNRETPSVGRSPTPYASPQTFGRTPSQRSPIFKDEDMEFFLLQRQAQKRPGPEDAGPSGAQQMQRHQATTAMPPAHSGKAVAHSGAPFSSQATLVNTQHTAHSRGEQVAMKREEEEEDSDVVIITAPQARQRPVNEQPSEGHTTHTTHRPAAVPEVKKKKAKRRINVVQPPPVILPVDDAPSRSKRAPPIQHLPPPSSHPFEAPPQRSARTSRVATPPPEDPMRGEDPWEDLTGDAAGDEADQSNEEEASVEDLVWASRASRLSALEQQEDPAEPVATQDLHPVDQVVHWSMAHDHRSPVDMRDVEDAELEAPRKSAAELSEGDTSSGNASASSSNASSANAPSMSHAPASQAARLSGARVSAAVATPLQRQPTTGSASSENEPVPMPGTRASEEKNRRKEALKRTPYTPPAGTRAAAAASRLELRSRTVNRPA